MKKNEGTSLILKDRDGTIKGGFLLLLCSYSPNNATPPPHSAEHIHSRGTLPPPPPPTPTPHPFRASAEHIHSRGTGRPASVQKGGLTIPVSFCLLSSYCQHLQSANKIIITVNSGSLIRWQNFHTFTCIQVT